MIDRQVPMPYSSLSRFRAGPNGLKCGAQQLVRVFFDRRAVELCSLSRAHLSTRVEEHLMPKLLAAGGRCVEAKTKE
jgi:hypothetical protein